MINDTPSDHTDNPELWKIKRYFVPGKVILYLEHREALSREELKEVLDSFLKEKASYSPWSQLETPEAGSFLTFPIQNKQENYVTIVAVPLHQDRADEEDEYLKTARVIHDLYLQVKETIDVSQKVSLQSIAPNWLMSGANHQIGLGGPGGWPDEADPPRNFTFPFLLPGFLQPGTEQSAEKHKIYVAILDTAPSPDDLYQAYDKWHHEHPLIDTLLRPRGPLHVYPASSDDFNLTVDFSLGLHRYKMSDHGLFVAGIIHSIAPQAGLHLYEVLNPYGVGCQETITRGLHQALTNPIIQRPLIINCSLVLNLPQAEQFRLVFPFEGAQVDMLEILQKPFTEMIELFAQDDIIIVAAAGNDSTGRHKFPARYPAADTTVLGVGALPKGHQTGKPFVKAGYSNRSDNPATVGYATLGGEEGKDKGVLGVYIGDIPYHIDPKPAPEGVYPLSQVGYRQNKRGWAWWSGTSFATPIISGILAEHWGIGSINSTAEAIRLLRQSTDIGDNGDIVIDVEQQV